MQPNNAFVRRLERLAPLSDDEQAHLNAALGHPRRVPSHVEFIREDQNTPGAHVVLDGFACCYKQLASGRRQIFSYLVPGDSCDFHSALLKWSDYSASTLSECTVATIDRTTVLRLTESHPAIARALWWISLVEAAILREWIAGLGQRSAEVRIAHLFSELHARMEAVGLTVDGDFELPITQAELADTVGLSAVHVNRSLRALKERGLVSFHGRRVRIPDVHRLSEFGGFVADYLHLHESAGDHR